MYLGMEEVEGYEGYGGAGRARMGERGTGRRLESSSDRGESCIGEVRVACAKTINKDREDKDKC